jgi:hypothetical protein
MNEGERPTASSTGAHAWAASASPRGRADGSPVPHAGGIWVSYSGSVARFKCTLASPRGFEISAVLQRGRPARGVQLEDYDRPLTNRSLQPTKPLCTIPLPESPFQYLPVRLRQREIDGMPSPRRPVAPSDELMRAALDVRQ